MEVKAAHDGERVQTLVLGASGTMPANSSNSSSNSNAGGSASSSNGNSNSNGNGTVSSASAVADTSTTEAEPTSSAAVPDGTLSSSEQDCSGPDASDPITTPTNEEATSTDPSTLDVLGTSDACATAPAAAATMSPAGSASSSPSAVSILYSGGDDKMVRRWDARLLTPIGAPLQVHNAAVKSVAVGDRDLLVSGDAGGEVAVWVV
eukprot:GHUV01031230.1.p2 GENE.GHUV01031230.1~~GHUV01031230.1.p2  ORF type:complete len:206 (-),score=89.76 GHUV01031230.1:626-1243(-)